MFFFGILLKPFLWYTFMLLMFLLRAFTCHFVDTCTFSFSLGLSLSLSLFLSHFISFFFVIKIAVLLYTAFQITLNEQKSVWFWSTRWQFEKKKSLSFLFFLFGALSSRHRHLSFKCKWMAIYSVSLFSRFMNSSLRRKKITTFYFVSLRHLFLGWHVFSHECIVANIEIS